MIAGVMEGRSHLFTEAMIDQVPVEGVRTFEARNEHTAFLARHGKKVVHVIQPAWTIGDALWTTHVRERMKSAPAFAYEIANEPPPEHWTRYWELVRIAAPIIRGAGKRAILGGFPPQWMEGGKQIGGAEGYLRAAHAAGVLRFVDGVGLHPYIADTAAQMRFLEERRKQLASYGWLKLPFYLTEFGVGAGGPPHPMRMGEPGQADYLTRAFGNFQANASRLVIAGAWWFIWRDYKGAKYLAQHAGVRRLDGSPKPSYAALKAVGQRA